MQSKCGEIAINEFILNFHDTFSRINDRIQNNALFLLNTTLFLDFSRQSIIEILIIHVLQLQ